MYLEIKKEKLCMFLNLQSIRAKIQFRDRWLCFSVSVCTYASVSPGAWIFRRAVTVYWVSHEEKAECD